MAQAADIVAAARGWLGTPFHHQGRKKSVGCDCIGMVLGVLDGLGLETSGQPYSAFDENDYAPDPNSQRLKEKMDRHFTVIGAADIQPGDLLLFRIIRLPQHVGIAGDHPFGGLSLIHAYAPAGKVVETVLTEGFLSRMIAAYRVTEVSAWPQ